jgi:hypothetical protein
MFSNFIQTEFRHSFTTNLYEKWRANQLDKLVRFSKFNCITITSPYLKAHVYHRTTSPLGPWHSYSLLKNCVCSLCLLLPKKALISPSRAEKRPSTISWSNLQQRHHCWCCVMWLRMIKGSIGLALILLAGQRIASACVPYLPTLTWATCFLASNIPLSAIHIYLINLNQFERISKLLHVVCGYREDIDAARASAIGMALLVPLTSSRLQLSIV